MNQRTRLKRRAAFSRARTENKLNRWVKQMRALPEGHWKRNSLRERGVFLSFTLG